MRIPVESLLYTLLLHSFTTCKTVAQAESDANESAAANNEHIVRVSLNGRDPIRLRVTPDGKPAYLDLPALDINSASVASDTDATCFIWHHNSRGNDMGDDFVSPAFRRGRHVLSRAYLRAERLYCYDSTRDRAANDVYALFLENRAGQKDLVRLRLRDGDRGYGLLDLEAESADADADADTDTDARPVPPGLRVNVRKAALIAGPVLPERATGAGGGAADGPTTREASSVHHPATEFSPVPFLNYCYALWEPGAKRFFTAANGVAFFPYKTLARIYCYKANMGYEDTIPFNELDNWGSSVSS